SLRRRRSVPRTISCAIQREASRLKSLKSTSQRRFNGRADGCGFECSSSRLNTALQFQVVAQLKIEKVVAVGCVCITYRIRGISSQFLSQLVIAARSPISTRVFAAKPVGANTEFVCDGLFQGELAARTVRVRSNDILAEEIAAK